MRGLDDDGRLSPETDAALQAAIGEVADEGDIVTGYVIVASLQGLDDPEPSTLLVMMPRQSTPLTLGLAGYAVAKCEADIGGERERDDG